MLRSLYLAAALAACAPIHQATFPTRRIPTWAYTVDMVAMSAAACVGLDGWSRHRSTQEVVGFSVAAAFYLPYWFGVGP